jgi:hypothetical protein
MRLLHSAIAAYHYVEVNYVMTIGYLFYLEYSYAICRQNQDFEIASLRRNDVTT